MDKEMDWEEYEKILMLRPGFKKALEETRFEYEIARTKIKVRWVRLYKMTSKGDIVVVTLTGKMVDQYIYTKNYVYSLDMKKLIEPDDTENYGDKYWKEFYCLRPGKYLIIEVDVDIENNCTYKSMIVFTKEDYISNKRKQSPNIRNFKKIYLSCGFETTEWKDDIPNWIKLPCECIKEIKEEYRQPQEVEDKLSSLLKEDGGKKPIIQYLSKKYNT